MMNNFHIKEKKTPVRSVQKALGLLDTIIQADLAGKPATLGELAQQAGMPPNSAHNLLKTLVACGYVQQRVRGRYEMGSKCQQLCRISFIQAEETRQAVLACLRRFSRRYEETCVLVSLVNGERVILGHVDSTQAVRVSHAMVREEPFFAKPTGRLLAAMSDEVELQQIIDRQGMPGEHWDGIDNRRDLAEALTKLRRDDVCIIVSPEQGVVAMAVPVAAGDDRLRCVLGVAAPLYRCDEDRRNMLLDGLWQTADELGEAFHGLGNQAPNEE